MLIRNQMTHSGGKSATFSYRMVLAVYRQRVS